MRKIAVVSVGRSDVGIYLPLLRAINADPELSLQLIATGAHLSPIHGSTVHDFEQHGIEVTERVDMLLAGDSPEAITKSMGVGLISFAQAYQRLSPDILVVMGDRFEMHAAALASVPFKIPLAHIHGGEVTAGAMDEAFRHAITKYAHLHFASTEEHARRIVQLGEEPWRVTVSGAPALDNLREVNLLSPAEVNAKLNLPPDSVPLLVTFHPVTLQFEQTETQISSLLSALDQFRMPIVITLPNADTNNHTIIRLLKAYASDHPDVRLAESLGTQVYFSLMRYAAAMVGNSSSGIIEAASFELPVVNIGIRQAGRPRSGNVIDVSHARDAIIAGIHQALEPKFRSSLKGMRNIYGHGRAAPYIVDRLRTEPLNERLLVKQFHDVVWENQRCAA